MAITFIGHSDVDNPTEVQFWLNETVGQLCVQGAKTFLLGGVHTTRKELILR